MPHANNNNTSILRFGFLWHTFTYIISFNHSNGENVIHIMCVACIHVSVWTQHFGAFPEYTSTKEYKDKKPLVWCPMSNCWPRGPRTDGVCEGMCVFQGWGSEILIRPSKGKEDEICWKPLFYRDATVTKYIQLVQSTQELPKCRFFAPFVSGEFC